MAKGTYVVVAFSSDKDDSLIKLEVNSRKTGIALKEQLIKQGFDAKLSLVKEIE